MVLLVSTNAFAKDVKDMTKEEYNSEHIALSEVIQKNKDAKSEVLKNACKKFKDFDNEGIKYKKIDIMNFDANDRSYEVENICDNLHGYFFK